MDEAELKRQRWLKIIVIGLGLLILLLLGTVITTILIRGNKAASKGEAKVSSVEAPQVAGPGFGDIKIALPAGARFEDMKAEDGRLYVRILLASGGTEVMVLNPATGRALGSLEFSAK